MAEIIRMPRLSDTMTEGTVAKWHKKVGDKVEEGELLAEIETDKATMEFESYEEGTILHIGVEEGDTAEVDSVLVIIGEKGEDYKGLLEGGGKEEKEEKEEKSTDKKDKKSEKEEEEQDSSEDEDDKKEEKKESAQKESSSKDKSEDSTRLKVSPLARKLAEDKGVDLKDVEGSGEGGRIVKRDIEEFKPKAAVSTQGQEGHRDEKVSQMRKTIARRLAESKFSAPHFYLTMEINMDEAVRARKKVNEIGEGKISFNDLVIKAAAAALKKHPKVNASWQDDTIRYYEHVHIGVAVAVEEGLLVPVVRHADAKGLLKISEEVKDYAQRAKDKKLGPADWEGNTFTISNLGMFGIEEFTAIINPPDACILAVGGIKETPIVKDGQIQVGNMMKVTLSCDHRVVDGATGADFLKTLKAYLENPVSMLM